MVDHLQVGKMKLTRLLPRALEPAKMWMKKGSCGLDQDVEWPGDTGRGAGKEDELEQWEEEGRLAGYYPRTLEYGKKDELGRGEET